jgi:hypothetical protein
MNLAVVVALDRSGSMAMPCGGKRKIDLANLGTVQVLDLLAPTDELGVVAVDSSPHIVVELGPVERNRAARHKIMRIDSLGGGIFIYEALSTAVKMLLSAQAATRHIILFADAADSEEPGSYQQLLAQAGKANITVSVIGLGTPGDCDAELLRDIARRGGGICMFTADANQIPRLFAQDTMAVARSSFIEDTTAFKLTAGMQPLTRQPFGAPPALGGYNLCYARPGANVAALTSDEYKAPIVASWFAGSGRALCLTAEANGKFTGPFGAWPEAAKFLVALAGWAAGRANPAPEDLLVTQEVKDGLYILELHLDPERKQDPFTGTPRAKILHGASGAMPAAETLNFNWKSADNLTVEFPISGDETLLAAVEIPGQAPFTLAPVCLPYSAEFKPDREGRGAATLDRLAAMTGGKERIDVASIWKEVPSTARLCELMPWLILVALLWFILEVFERRTGLLVSRRGPAALLEKPLAFAAGAIQRLRKPAAAAVVRPEKKGMPAAAQPKEAPPAEPAPAKPAPAEPLSDGFAAMRQARKKAAQRLDDK